MHSEQIPDCFLHQPLKKCLLHKILRHCLHAAPLNSPKVRLQMPQIYRSYGECHLSNFPFELIASYYRRSLPLDIARLTVCLPAVLKPSSDILEILASMDVLQLERIAAQST